MDYIGIITGIIGITTAILGGLAWYKGAIEQRYASHRDFGHLKRNYEQLNANLLSLMKEEDARFDELRLELREMRIHLGLHDSGPRSGFPKERQ